MVVLYVLLALAGLVLLLIIGISVLALRALDQASSGGSVTVQMPRGAPDGLQPFERPFQRTGDPDLAYSVRLSGTAFRWHATERVETGAAFHRMFVDGPWKWDAQARFAGAGINCGHYFGLSIEAATEEAGYYGTDTAAATLIAIEGESSRILELTHPEVIKAVFEAHVDDHQVVSRSYYTMLQELIEQQKGGNAITDYLGWWAKRSGYDGILFFSARALKQAATYNYNRNLEGLTYQAAFYEMRKDPRLLNVVFLSGARLVGGIQRITIGSAPPFDNPHAGQPEAVTAALAGAFGADYQAEWDRFLLTRPRYDRGPPEAG